jgi:hypothetical protein
MDLVELLQIASSEEKNGKVYINGIEGFGVMQKKDC